MDRVGIFFKLKPGKKDEYQKRHREIWPEISEILNVAGFRNYSIWNEGEMLFAYYEITDQQRADLILSNSEHFYKWRKEMEEYIYVEPETGKKEWFMECLFLHE